MGGEGVNGGDALPVTVLGFAGYIPFHREWEGRVRTGLALPSTQGAF